jgi:membrane protease YdiL (CAAX protease family)
MPLAALLMHKTPALPVAPKKLKAGQFMIIMMICFTIMYAGNLAGNIINLIIQALAQSDMTNLIQELIAGSSIWANLVFVVLLAPVMEELFFRRLLIKKLLAYGEKPAVILSGLAFGLIHGNLTQFFYAFGLGLAFGYIFVKTGKVIYTIILHMIINFIGSVISVLALQTTIASMLVTGPIMLAVFGMAIAGIVLFFKNKKRIVMSPGLFAIAKGKRAVFLNAGMILFYIVSAALFIVNTYSMLTET